MKTMKMPVKTLTVKNTPYEVFSILREYIYNETVGLDDDCKLLPNTTKKDLIDILNSLQFYLAQAREPQILPLTYQVIDDEKFEEEYKEQCQK